MQYTIPYLIVVIYDEGMKTKTYVGSHEKNGLRQKLLEEIAELMVLHSKMKKTGPDIIQNVMYFENECWHIFDIFNLKEKEKLMNIYEEKYNHFYVESEEEMSDSNSEDEDSLEDRWDAILRLHGNSQEKIYNTHVRLMEKWLD